MKNIILLSIAFFSFLSSFGQYSDPYRMAFDGNNYYITNKGNGTISKLTSTGAHSTVVTGLHSPNDIFYGAVAGNSVIIILDSNIIKIYDSTTFSPLLNVPITGAVEAHDGMFNPNNSNEFFISDRGGNKIIKGSVGSAPFYPITFTTHTSNITKPAGMIINNQGNLIVVSDTINGNIYEVSPTSGSKTTVLSAAHDNISDVAQDSEGNYYITNWGDSKLYRYSSTWTNPYTVATYNNPSGLYADVNNDLLGICCTNCQKVEFKLFHLFSPLSDVTSCTADSFDVSFTPTFNGIGTYNSGNRFKIEMSDSNGSFFNSIAIGEVITNDVPTYIKAEVPSGTPASTGYKYRIASTSPVHYSYFIKDLTVLTTPEAGFLAGDTLYGCVGTSVELKHSEFSDVGHSFFPPTGITTLDSATFSFTSGIDSNYSYMHQVVNNTSGCSDITPFVLSIGAGLQISLADTLTMCEGDTIQLINNTAPYKYTWQGSSSINSHFIANPTFYGADSTLISVTFSDSTETCFGTDSLYVVVNDKPLLAFTLQVPLYCYGEPVNLQDEIVHDSLFGIDSFFLSKKINNIPKDPTGVYNNLAVGDYQYTVTYTSLTTGCSNVHGNGLTIFHIGDSLTISEDKGKEIITATKHNTISPDCRTWWQVNGITVSPRNENTDSILTSTLQDGDTVQAFMRSEYECALESEIFVWKKTSSINDVQLISFFVMPNPSKGKFEIKGLNQSSEVRIFDINGKLVSEYNSNLKSIETHGLKGMYIVEVKTKGGIGRKRILIQ